MLTVACMVWGKAEQGFIVGQTVYTLAGIRRIGGTLFRRFALAVLLAGSCRGVSALPGLPIREGAQWRYYKGTSTPALQGTNQWYRPEYSDATWGGPAPSGFGYGDCDDATQLGDMQNSYLSVFTRTAFQVDNPASVAALTLAADYDDGLIAYLNGSEVARRNMPEGAIVHSTAASGNHESSRGDGTAPPNEMEFMAINPALLVAGTNILAVAGHNISAGSSDASLIVELYTNVSLVRGPFIQMPDPGASAAIAWRTAAPADSVVDHGLDLSYTGGTVSNGGLRRDHTIHLANLAPGTTHYYRVRGNGEVLAEGLSFRSRPAADQNYRLAVIGDHGQGTEWMTNIAHELNARTDFDAILTVGDNIYGPIPCSLDGAPGWYDPFWFSLYGPSMARVSTFPALGNHDWDTASGQYMVDYFRLPANGPAGHIGKNYSFEFGNMHIAVIDTEPYEDDDTAAMSAINVWLAADLAAATQRWRSVLLHRPPFTSQASHDDHVRVKANIVPILKAGGVQLVFQGHNHWYERINPIDGTHYITTGGAGAWLYAPALRKDYSAVLYNTRHSYTLVDVQSGRLTLQQMNDQGAMIDEFSLDLDHPFSMDGLLDSPAWLRAANGMKLHAAIRGPYLYVAAEDAGEGSDHFVYVADTVGTQRPANWSKSGAVMQWGAFLADENDGAYHAWFDAGGTALGDFDRYKSTTSGLNNNGAGSNGVLEGTLALADHFGSFPQQLYLAVAPFATTNGGHLHAASQVPAGNGDGNLDSTEFLVVSTRDLALDLPVPLVATNAPAEAGMALLLDGGASYSPSDLPLTYSWSRMDGPTGVIETVGAPQSAFRLSQNVSGIETVRVALSVHDGRFSETARADVVFFEMTDGDGDGLSTQEELTGLDNRLTPPDPAGRQTDPGLADSDGDGMGDGHEAVAGTNPNDSSSLFKIVGNAAGSPEGLVLKWSSSTGRQYRLWSATNLAGLWTLIASNIAALPPMNTFTIPALPAVDYFTVEGQAP